MNNFEKIWNSFTEEKQTFFKRKVLRNSMYKRYLTTFISDEIPDLDTLKSLGKWLREEIRREVQEKIEEDDYNKELEKVKEMKKENSLMHTNSYYYDENRDVYVVHIPSKNKPLALNGDLWRGIKSAYSNWGDAPSTVNQICRKFSLSRRTVIELLRVMGMTHDSSPWTDEEVRESDEATLVADLIRRKEEKVLLKAQRKSWRKVTVAAEKYNHLEHFMSDVKAKLEDINTRGIDIPELKFKNIDKAEKDYAVVISPTDFHWGKLGSVTTNDPYNRAIAKERLLTSTFEVLERIKHRGRPEKIFLAIGGDGLHIDNQHRQTTKGTPQECDGTPSELASSYVHLVIEYVELVRQFADVHVIFVPGNHDYYTTAILREAVRAWYRKEIDVTVFDDISPRQTFLYGKSLLSFIHGDQGNIKNYPNIIASEKAHLWGQSKWRFIFTGHIHTERELPQFGDTTIYRMPSLAGSDEYHFKAGYKSRKALIGYIIDKEKGVIATEIVPIG